MLHKEMLKFGEIYMLKKQNKTKQIDINDVNIENILVLYKYYIGEACWKYFIGYVNHFDDDIKPVLIKLPKLSGSVKKKF